MGSFYNKVLYRILACRVWLYIGGPAGLCSKICTLTVPHTAWLVAPHHCHRRQLVNSAKVLYWVWLTQLTLAGWELPPPTQQGFAEPLLLSSPSTSSARICWAAATAVSFHKLSKDLLSRCSNDSARMLSLTPPPICTQQGVTQYKSNWVSSTSSARICWAYPE